MKPTYASSTASTATEDTTNSSSFSTTTSTANDWSNSITDHSHEPSLTAASAPRFFHIREARNSQCSCDHCYSPILTSFRDSRVLTRAKRVQANVVTVRDSRIFYDKEASMDNTTSNGFDLPMRGRPPAPRSPPSNASNLPEVGMNVGTAVNGHSGNFSSAAASMNARAPTPAQPLNGAVGQVGNDRLIVGVDFGTTYSGYANRNHLAHIGRQWANLRIVLQQYIAQHQKTLTLSKRTLLLTS